MEWTEGMKARIVAHDPETHEPTRDGKSYPAAVRLAGAVFVQARRDEGGDWPFYQGTGWCVVGSPFRWRLMPAGDTEQTEAGQ